MFCKVLIFESNRMLQEFLSSTNEMYISEIIIMWVYVSVAYLRQSSVFFTEKPPGELKALIDL